LASKQNFLVDFWSDKEKLLGIAPDIRPWILNTGVLAFKTGAATQRLLRHWWESALPRELIKLYHEQSAIQRLMGQEPAVDASVYVFPGGGIHTYYLDKMMDTTRVWKEGDFLVHIKVGIPRRPRVAKEFIERLGLLQNGTEARLHAYTAPPQPHPLAGVPITLFSWSDRPELSSLTWPTLQRYCDRWGLRFLPLTQA
jgi:hypothetical protein